MASRVITVGADASGRLAFPGTSYVGVVGEGATAGTVPIADVPPRIAGGVGVTITINGETRAVASITDGVLTLAEDLGAAPGGGAQVTITAEWTYIDARDPDIVWLYGEPRQAADEDLIIHSFECANGQVHRGSAPEIGDVVGFESDCAFAGYNGNGGKPLRGFYLRGAAGRVVINIGGGRVF